MTIDTKKIRAMCGAATPGRIDVHRFDDDDASCSYQLQRGENDPIVLGYMCESDGNWHAKHDAALFAVARETILALLDELERVR